MSGKVPLKTVLRALDVLELVGHSVNGFKLQHLTDILDQKASTTHALLRTLVDRGYLIKLHNPIRYMLNTPAVQLDQRPANHERMLRIGSLLSRISHQSGMCISFQKFIANSAFVLLRVCPERYLSVEKTDWQSFPYGTAVVFQAYRSPQEQERYWAANHLKKTHICTIWGNFDNLRKYLSIAAKQRLVIMKTQADRTLRIAAPIFDRNGKVTTAICAHQTLDKINADQARIGIKLIYHAALMLSSAPAATAAEESSDTMSALARFDMYVQNQRRKTSACYHGVP